MDDQDHDILGELLINIRQDNNTPHSTIYRNKIKTLLENNLHILTKDVNNDGFANIFHLFCVKSNYEDVIEHILNILEIKGRISDVLDIKNKDGYTPLYFATMYKNLNTIKILIKFNADPRILCITGATLFHKAVIADSLEILKYLIEIIPDLKDKKIAELSPLLLAALNGRFELVKFLLECGCKIDFDTKEVENLIIREYLDNFQDLPSY